MPLHTIKGTLERIIFQSEETHFTVAKLQEEGKQDLTTIVGPLPGVNPGETLELRGQWVHSKDYGEQFKVEDYQTIVPATLAGIEKYLGSGLIKGIGPVTARRITSHFKLDTLEIIEHSSQKLLEVEGVGEKRLDMIIAAWEAQKEIKEVMLFLQSHGVSTTYAVKIYKQYRKDAITVVQDNPYRLAHDIYGIGFKTADKIAADLGIAKDSPKRLEAGILYVLSELTDEGYTCYPYSDLVKKAATLLDAKEPALEEAIGRLRGADEVVIEEAFKPGVVYLKALHVAETSAAERLRYLRDNPRKKAIAIDIPRAITWVEGKLSIKLSQEQKEAISKAITEKALVITGGPGVGKTTVISSIVKILTAKGLSVVLAAPTGRAARRMSELTGMEAKTIHRLLEYSPPERRFQRNQDHPLEADVVIIDESSMVDVLLMHHLLKAIDPGSTLILVGDVDQLPSVGPGNVLCDIIASGVIPVVRLTEIFRQAKESFIITNAHLVNQGRFPFIQPDPQKGKEKGGDLRDFYFIQREEPNEVLETIIKLVHEWIPRRFSFDPISEIQVLTPMNRGLIGAQNLNMELQKVLTPDSGQSLQRGSRSFRPKDKVMQLRNNYEKEVFNGDIGRISRIDQENQEVHIDFDGRTVTYDFSDMDELTLAYAATVHKAQGSEYPCVVMPMHTVHYPMLQRNLLYTGITRAKKLLVIVGTRKALGMAVRNEKRARRYSMMGWYLGREEVV